MGYIEAIECAFPETVLSNESLVANDPNWNAERVYTKLGIRERRVAEPSVFVSDLATKAALKLVQSRGNIDDVDFIILCTQTPDYLLPTTSCLIQKNLGLPSTVGSLDINLGCSGYIYGLMLADSLVSSGACQKVLLLTADTYTKLLAKEDISNRLIFGDGASATFITKEKTPLSKAEILKFNVGTDGRGAENLIARQSGVSGIETSSKEHLFMNGPEIFNFTMREVPKLLDINLANNSISQDDISHYVFHQANEFMLESLRKKMKLPSEKFVKHFSQFGNTVSSTIPIALENLFKNGQGLGGSHISLVGFGVGYSWGATVLRSL